MDRRLLLTILIAVLAAPAGRALADASVEGVVELPKPTMAKPLSTPIKEEFLPREIAELRKEVECLPRSRNSKTKM